MKKIVFVLILMFCFVTGVNAEEVTFNNLPDILKNSLTYEEFLEEDIACNISKTDSTLDITCDLKSDGKYTTHFDYDGSVLSFNSTAANGSLQRYFDTLWILQLSNNTNGFFGTKISGATSELDALKKMYTYVITVYNGNSFSMDIERGAVIDDGNNDNTGNDSGNAGNDNNDNTGNNSGNTGNNNNDNNVVDNPQTGSIVFFVIIALFFVSVVSIIFYKKSLDEYKEI